MLIEPCKQLGKPARGEREARVRSPEVDANLVVYQGPATGEDDVPDVADLLVRLAGREQPLVRPLQHATWILQIEQCESNGIEFIELQVGNDGISVMTNTANDAVECLNFADLYALTGPESQGFDNWSDAQDLASELGSECGCERSCRRTFGASSICLAGGLERRLGADW